MLAKLFTYSLFGIDANPVEVEVDISPGAMPKTILVGLAEAAVRESTYRVERALVNSGYSRPIDRIVINLSPADMPKDAPSFDLPIALGLLTASGQLTSDRFNSHAAVGELALEGTLRVGGWTLLALAAALTIDGSFPIPQELRWVLLSAGGLALSWGVYAWLIRPWRGSSWSMILDAAARRFPELREFLRPAWDLSRDGPGPGTSQALADAHIERTERLLNRLAAVPVF
ncbi:MAG: hypothetical protein IID45_09460, partial [Planctomycetes bacterium]|nr:hypothetical protein [Planctomycetota bacterium]